MQAPYNSDNYRRILSTALQQGYRFLSFLESPSPGASSLYLRHDVDFSLKYAAELASINAELGVRGTFFVLLRSHAYNAFAPSSLQYLAQIAEHQQWIGLHAYTPFTTEPSQLDALESMVQEDFTSLKRLAPAALPIFAWHNPTAEIVELSQRWTVPGMTNAYHPRFTKEMVYRSDSNFRNSVEDLVDILRQGHSAVQLLFHPLNWIAGGKNMSEILAKTWSAVMREAECEFLTNRTVPGPMPQEFLDQFTTTWQRWVGQAGETGS